MNPRSVRVQAAAAACVAAVAWSCSTSRAPVSPRSGARPPLELLELGEGLPRTGQWRNGFALADLDGDGFLDLLHGPSRKGSRRPVVFRGDGKGGFRRWTDARFPDCAYDYGDAAVTDLDGDGDADAALAMHLKGFVVLRNDGGGGFSEAGRPGEGSGFSARALALADWDGDRRPDIVAFGEGPSRLGLGVAEGSNGLAVFLNRGNGSWPRVNAPGLDPAFGDALAVGDVDGDGHIDAVTAAGGGNGRAILHHNTGESWQNLEVAALRADAMVGSVAVADVDGDRRVDICYGYVDPTGGEWHAGVDVLLGRKDAFERREVLREQGKNTVRALAIGDLDDDGANELIAVRGDGAVQILSIAGGVRATAPAPEWRTGCSGYGLALGDLNGDGHPEIVASFAGESSAFALVPERVSGGGIQAWAVRSAR
jgi:hypothetical protein